MSDDHPMGELLTGYALGCLDSEEEKAVGEHLARCESCSRELASLMEVSDRLSLLVPLVEPPKSLEKKIMRKMGEGGAGERRRSPVHIHPVWLAAAAVLIAALALGNILQLRGRTGTAQAPKGGLVTAVLVGEAPVKDAYGTIVLDPEDNKGVLAVRGLPALDQTRQYQLWLGRGGEKRSGGVFSVDGDGYGSMVLTVPPDFRNFTSISISAEPKGGSPLPTGPAVMSGGMK